MSVFFFFLVSTLLHCLLLSLPVPSENPGQQAIPFTFLVMERASPTALPQGRADTDIKPTKPPSNPPVAVTKVQNEHEPVSALGKKGDSRPKPTQASKTKPAVIIARLEKRPLKKEQPRKPKTETSVRPVRRQANQVREIIPVTTASDFVPPTSSASVKKREVEEATSIAWEEDSLDWATLDHHDWITEATAEKRPGSHAVPKKAIPTQSLARRSSPKFTPAAYATWAPPDYPERAWRKGWQGTTLLRVLVNNRGSSETVEISRSSGFSILDGAAVEAVQSWRFRPAHDGRKTVKSWVKVPIVFRLENAK